MGRKPILGEKETKDILNKSIYNMFDKHVIVENYKVSDKTAERFMKKHELIHTSSENIECISEYLNGESVQSLIKKYNMSQVNLNALMRYRNIPQRGTQYFADFNYFEKIDSEDKAYFLGFIYADGCIYKNSIIIGVSSTDIDILYKLKEYMNSNHKINNRINSNGRKMSEIWITHKNIPSIMLKHGLEPNKTHKIKEIPDTIPQKFIKDFIRGYIDGDGSFGKYKHNDGYFRSSLSIVSTKDFLLSIKEHSENISGSYFLEKLKDRWPERKTNTRTIHMSGNDNVCNYLDWLYRDSTVYMDRKYNIYLDMIK